MKSNKTKKNTESPVTEYKAPGHNWYVYIIAPLMCVNVLIFCGVFAEEYAVYSKENAKARNANEAFFNRYEFLPRGGGGGCPYQTTPYNETDCLRIRDNFRSGGTGGGIIAIPAQ